LQEIETERHVVTSEEKHPADEIALALSRAGGILTSLHNCYDRQETSFAIGLPFVVESIIAIESILNRANTAVISLYENYDLSPLQRVPEPAPIQEVAPPTEDVLEPYFVLQPSVASRLASKLDEIIETLPTPEYAVMNDHLQDSPARTYDELLTKLIAMTDAAADKNTHRDNLLPLIESLRADVERMRQVA
jgi:hypothetical protein